MKIDHTNLLKALKREPVGGVIPNAPHPGIPDAEKIEVSNELHDWLKDKK